MKKFLFLLALMLPALLGTSHLMAQNDTTCQAIFISEQNDSDPMTVDFQDVSFPQGAANAWNWSFGDGDSSTEQNPSHTYATEGTYEVTFQITTATCSSTIILPVTVSTDTSGCNCPQTYDPVCVLTPNDGIIEFINVCFAACEGYSPSDFVDCGLACQVYFDFTQDANDYLTFTFAESDFSTSPIITWAWDFGDGTTGSTANPTHTYDQSGTYEVTLSIMHENGCSSTYSAFVNAFDGNPCNCPTDYDPVCVATPNGGIIEYPNECMAICDGFTPNLFVQCDSTTYDYCDAMFCYESDIDNALAVSFHDFSFSFSTITGWAWDFGDGATSTEQNPTHTYADYGVYSVSLTITTADGCSSEITMEVWLDDNAPCNCPATYDPVCVETPNGEIFQFWNTCEAECYGFTDFVVCDSLPQNDCDAIFGYYQDFLSNDLAVNFEDYSYSSSPITAWAWDFGDGTSSTDQNPTHTYTTAGEYTVTLTITSDNCTSSFEEVVFVGDFTFPDCQAFFWPFPDSAGTDLTYQFIDFSLGNPDTWAWDFGDGTTSTAQNPLHTYATAGTYTVSLSISGANCQSSFELVLDTDDFFVSPNDPTSDNVQALFTPIIDLASNAVYFKNQSTSTTNITEITYNFGDGQEATAENVQHTFPAKKAYNVTMHVKNATGQTSSFVGTIDLKTGMFKSSTNTSSIILSNPKITKEDFGLALTPNPASSDVTVAFTTSVAGKYSIEITSVTGQSLYRTSFHGAKGQNKVNIDVQDYPLGLYLLKLQVNDSYQTYKLVKE